jgi:hypothetical protein
MKIGAAYGKLLSGESVIREFLTIGIGDQIREKVYLQMVDRVLDVSGNHWLLGLDPRVVGIWIEKKESGENLKARAPYTLYFRDSAPTGNESIARNALGVLRMEYVNEIVENNGTLFLFKVLASSIHHIDFLRARLLYQKFYKKPGVCF